jgi:hypothetical protein
MSNKILLTPTGLETPYLRTTFLTSAFLLGVGLLLSLYFPAAFFLLVLATVFSIAVLVSILLAILYSSYNTLPLVKQKNAVLLEIRKQSAQYLAADTDYHDVLTAKEQDLAVIHQQRQEAVHAYQKTTHQLTDKTFSLQKACENEIHHQLVAIQNQFLSAALVTPLTAVKIHGIGPVIIERMTHHGVRTIGDIKASALANIPGIGDAKRADILRFRTLFENETRASAPAALPSETVNSIRAPYVRQVAEIEVAIQQAHEQHSSFLENIDATEAESESNWAPQIAEKLQLRQPLEDALEVLREQKKSLAQVTYRQYLNACLGLPIIPIRRGGASVVFNSSLVIVFLLLLSGATLCSGGVTLIDNLPTLTATPSITLTATSTPTYTITFTPTITATFTLTLSPTLTLMPSATNTATYTLTKTKTATLIPTFTPSRLPITEIPTLRLCGSLCNDGFHSTSTGGSGTCSHHGGRAGPWYC